MAANPDYAPGEVIANKYVVEGLAGESPAARTFLANGNAGRVAVKIYRPDTSAKLLAAPDFFLKAVIMTEIGHDNLGACIEVQEEMGQIFVARAFAEGESFEEWDRKRRGQPGHLARGLELLWQACQGLSVLHERTRHLNIHPGNFIVGPVMAKLCDPDPRALGNMEMTPDLLPIRPEYLGYRAPEMTGRGGGFLSYPSTDLFAIAGLLFRLVKGEHPSSNPAQTLSDARALDRDLALFLGKALHPKPEERFQEAASFADALWELQGTMQRLQESSADRPAVRSPASGPRAAEPAADRSPSPPGKEPTLFGAPAKAKGDESFFDFFPAEPTAPKGDTLFGAPASPSAQPTAPRPEPVRRDPAPPPRGGLSQLEQPGTLFGSSAPSAADQAVPARPGVPSKAKPLAVSISSLEKDPMDASASGDSGGFTAYGFKGAGDNRTGIYNPDGKAAAARAKLRLLLGITGGLALVAGLVALFIFLRGNAADQAKPAGTPVVDSDEPAAPVATRPDQPTAPGAATGQPYPEVSSPEAPGSDQPGSGQTPPRSGTPAAAATTASDPKPAGYSEPPMPVEPPRPGALSETPAPAAKPPKAAYQGNAHVTPEREAQLMALVQTRAWPPSASERLRAADDLNDLGRTAEANLLYGKALEAGGATEKQKVSALGGLAVTFQTMGMHAQAKDAVEKILAINPRNPFALKMKAKL